MAMGAAHQVASGKIDGAAFGPQAAVHGHFSQGRAVEVKAVAGLAGRFVLLIPVSVAVFAVPAAVGDVVQTVGAVGGQGQAAGCMAGRALLNHPLVALQADRGHIVVGRGVDVGPDGVGAAVAAFAEDPAVALAETIQGSVVFGKT